MTIALGVLTPSHMVFAADSQEGIGGGIKMPMNKIAFNSALYVNQDGLHQGKCIVVTGAGNSEYLRYISQEITNYFNSSELTIDEFAIYLREEIEEFHQTHVIPYGNLDTFTVSLIVGAQCLGERGMWVTYLGTVQRVDNYATVGSGSSYARSILSCFVGQMSGPKTALIMAAYAALSAKLRDDSCGLDTMLVSVDLRCGVDVVDWATVRKIEDIFRKYEVAEKFAVIATAANHQSDLGKTMEGMRREFADLDFFKLPQWVGELASNQAAPQRQQSTTGDSSPQQPSQESPGGSDES